MVEHQLEVEVAGEVGRRPAEAAAVVAAWLRLAAAPILAQCRIVFGGVPRATCGGVEAPTPLAASRPAHVRWSASRRDRVVAVRDLAEVVVERGECVFRVPMRLMALQVGILVLVPKICGF